VLVELARTASVGVTLSIPFWDPDKARAIEPFVATPLRRIRAIETLAKNGISVGVNVAPIIPGLNEDSIAEILTAARAAGATRAHYTLLRLPGSVKAVFEERLRAKMPLSADKVLHRIRETRGGKLYDSTWRKRQVGDGEYADMIGTLFAALKNKLGFDPPPPQGQDADAEDPPTTFRRASPRGQLSLFD
jgi:DNA repair photolyase